MDPKHQDVIAYLYPLNDDEAADHTRTILMPDNASRLVPGKPDPYARAARSAREASTEPVEHSSLEHMHCLAIRFSEPPKTRAGLVVGQSPKADLRLPERKEVSGYHFMLAFDEHSELVIRDLDSTYGMRVQYGDAKSKQGRPKGFTWSARGPRLKIKGQEVPVIIRIANDIQFRVVLPEHDVTCSEYREKVAHWLKGAAEPEKIFEELDILSGKHTQLPTPGGPRTPCVPKPEQIVWSKKLSSGGFGRITYVWNVTTRKEFALKEPLRKGDADLWKREAEILKDITHDNIVKLLHTNFEKSPKLYFEYVPGGDLSKYMQSTPSQRLQIANQLLSGLVYLHDTKSLAHRDIKPENVLVQHWTPSKVHVKLGDFGLAKPIDDMITFCGTYVYVAPELFSAYGHAKYDEKCDMWSLGVLLARLEYQELPKFESHYRFAGEAWGEKIIGFVKSRRAKDRSGLDFLIDDMLELKPAKRESALYCRDKALGYSRSGADPDNIVNYALMSEPNSDFYADLAVVDGSDFADKVHKMKPSNPDQLERFDASIDFDRGQQVIGGDGPNLLALDLQSPRKRSRSEDPSLEFAKHFTTDTVRLAPEGMDHKKMKV